MLTSPLCRHSYINKPREVDVHLHFACSLVNSSCDETLLIPYHSNISCVHHILFALIQLLFCSILCLQLEIPPISNESQLRTNGNIQGFDVIWENFKKFIMNN